MPTTTYTDSTFAVTAIGGRTNSAGTGVSDWTAEESRLLAQILGEGALTTNAFIPAQQTVADMTVKIGSGTSKSDVYVVAGDVTGQGNYVVRLDVASVNVTIGAADASQARTDEIYLVVQDTTYDASARGLPRLGYRKGDLGGANPGVDSTWKGSALIARITVPAAATTITTARISDQRVTGGLRLPQGANLNVGGSTSTAYIAAAAAASSTETVSVGVVADTVSRLAVRADGRLSWGSGSGAADTNLYRTSADTLRTDDHLQVGGNANVDSLDVVGDMTVGDDVTYASGSVLTWAADTNVYRGAANQLKTDDTLSVGGSLIVGGTTLARTPGTGTTGYRLIADSGAGDKCVWSRSVAWESITTTDSGIGGLNTWIAPDTAVGTSFVAPPSGQVMISLGAGVTYADEEDQVHVGYRIGTGSTVGAGSVYTAAAEERSFGRWVLGSGASGGWRDNMTDVVTGLTAGSTYNAQLQVWVGDTGITITHQRLSVIPL